MWEKVKLSPNISILSGFAFKSSLFTDEAEYIPIIRIRDIKRSYSDTFYKGDYKEEYIIRNGDYVIGMDGEFNIAKWEGVPSLLNQRVCKISSTDKSILNEKYLFHIISKYLKEIEDKTSFVTVKHLSVNDIKNIEIPLPPLPIQEKIAKILDKADELRRKDKELQAKYDELAQAIFIDMFGKYLKSAKNSLSDFIQINPKKSELNKEKLQEVSFVPMASVGEKGQIDVSQIKKLNEVYTGFTYFRENDVLFAKITPCMENGKGAIAKNLKNKVGFGSTEFHVLRPSELLKSTFIYYLLSLKNIRKFAEINMTGSAGQKRVPSNFFSKISLEAPPLHLQEAFAKKIELINQLKAQTNTAKSEELFQSLLQKAFKGELVS